MMEGRRRLTLLEQMSASGNGRTLAGLTLDDVVSTPKQPPTPPALPATIAGRTLLDIIRDEEPKSYRALIGKKDHKRPNWKSLKDRLRLNKGGAAWSSSVRVPTSDLPVQHRARFRHNTSRRNPVRYVTPESNPVNEEMAEDNSAAGNSSNRPTIQRRSSTRLGPNAAMPSDDPAEPAPLFARRGSVRFPQSGDDAFESPRRRLETEISEERSLSAREAVAAQQAAEAAAAAAATAEEESGEDAVRAVPEPEPVRMSLMDLLEETDRQMGLEGSRYDIGDEEEEEEEEEEELVDEQVVGNTEHNCCVCMVRHKGAAFIPCGHTFCRMCSRELWVQRGNCPLCNNFILEILDIF